MCVCLRHLWLSPFPAKPEEKKPAPGKKEPEKKPVDEAMKKDAAPANKNQAGKKEPETKKDAAPKQKETPQIVVDDEGKNSGLHRPPPLRDHSTSPSPARDDGVVNGDSRNKPRDKGRPGPKSKQKAYTKAPTTILEEGMNLTLI